MNTALSSFSPLEPVENIWIAQTPSLRCTALRLNDGSLCLYSPVSGLGTDALASLKSLGEISYLLAPNHYHNKGLAEYAHAFPAAKLVCSPKAKLRLEKQTGLAFDTYESLNHTLLPNMTLVEPDGLKTGEVWMTIKSETHRVCVVTDAFRGQGKNNTAPSDRVELLGTFPKFGIRDLTQYAIWLASWAKKEKPDILVPCHGSIAAGKDIASQAVSLVNGLET